MEVCPNKTIQITISCETNLTIMRRNMLRTYVLLVVPWRGGGECLKQ
jgi:hypothetical protein